MTVCALMTWSWWLQVFSSTEEIDTILKCLPTSDEMIKLQPYLQGSPLSPLPSHFSSLVWCSTAASHMHAHLHAYLSRSPTRNCTRRRASELGADLVRSGR